MTTAIARRSGRQIVRRAPDVIEMKPLPVVTDSDARADVPFWRVAIEALGLMLLLFVFVKAVIGLLYVGDGVPLIEAFAFESSDAYVALFAVLVGKWRFLAW